MTPASGVACHAPKRCRLLNASQNAMQIPQGLHESRGGCTACAKHASVERQPQVRLYTISTWQRSPAATEIACACRLDMASFTTTWMDKEAEALIAETQAINIVDSSQYPQCKEMENRYNRCWHPVSKPELPAKQWLRMLAHACATKTSTASIVQVSKYQKESKYQSIN